MKNHPTKNTLLQFPQANAETKNCKRVFFSPPQEKLKIKKSPPLQKNKTSFHRTVQTLTDIALNVNRLEQNVCGLELYSFGRTAAHAGNIKIKRNLKKKGFGGYRKFVQVMKCVQVQKNATEESGVNNFNYLLHFFASTVVLSIPSFLNFVNPFFVTCNAMTTITKNKFTFWGRIIFIVPLIWLFMKPIQNTLTRDVDTFHLLLLVFFLTFVILMASFLFVGLLLKPITLTIINNERQFYTYSILSGNTTYSISDIKGFSKTKLWTRAKDYPGILLYLKDNSKVELTEFNLQSLKPFVKFLNDENINYFGEETSWFPFRPIHFRFDK